MAGANLPNLLRILGRSHNTRDLSLEGNEAKSKPMESTSVNRWRESKQEDTHESIAKAMGISVDQVKQMMADGRLTEKNASHEDDLAAIVAAQNSVEAPPIEDQRKQPSKASTIADAAQAGLDAVGVVDPTPISDGINAAWSVGRAFTDPERRSEHLQNAAISAVSMVPYIGDTAKLFKAGRYAKTASRLAGMNDGASAATKASQRSDYRDNARAILGGGSSGSGGGGNGGGDNVQSPPLPPPGSDGPNGPNQDETAAAKSFMSQLSETGDALLRFAGPVGKAAVTVAGFVKGLELLNAGVIALNKDLAPYNGQLSAAYARSDTDELQRDMRKGESLSVPLSELIDEQSELKDTMASLMNPLEAIGVGLLATVTKGVNTLVDVTMVVKPMAKALEAIKSAIFRILNIQEGGANETLATQSFFRDVSDGKFDGREPKFGLPPGNMDDVRTEQERRGLFGP